MKICRQLLVVAVVLMVGSWGMMCLMFPKTCLAAMALLTVTAAKRQHRRLTTLGSARWADANDMRRAGMLDASSGLILGRVTVGRTKIGQALKCLADRNMNDEVACKTFVNMCGRPKQALVRLPNAIHTSIFAPTGVGKTVSCVVPYLLATREPVFVLDVKDGELAKLTAEARKKMGRRVHIIDPYRCVTNTPATLDPVNFIDKSSKFAIDDAREIAAAIVERKEEKGDGNSTHFLDNAEAAIAALIATVVEYGEEDQKKSLQAVCDIASDPKRWDRAVQLMVASPVQEGMLSRMGGNLTHLKDRELASTMSTIARFLRFLSTPAIAESTTASSFDPNEILQGNTDVYCVLAADRVATLSPLLRLWTGTFLRAAQRSKGKQIIHFICDEAGSSLGKMDQIATALTVGRSAGVRLQLYYQDLGQLAKCWPDGADQTLLANTTQVFFGVNDPQSAEFCSSRLGDATIIVTSGGTSEGKSVQITDNGQGNTTRSDSTNDGWQQQARRLLKPDEVAALDPRTAITFAPGMPPVSTTLLRYYEERLRPERWWKRRLLKIKLAVDCIALLLAAIFIMGVVFMANEQLGMPMRLPGGSQTMKGR